MKETLLKVDGMTCSSCVRHIQAALRKLDGVSEVDVRLREGTVLVKHDATKTGVPALVEAIRQAGYEPKAQAA